MFEIITDKSLEADKARQTKIDANHKVFNTKSRTSVFSCSKTSGDIQTIREIDFGWKF